MLFWVFMLVMSILIPTIMVAFGRRFRKAAPDKINRVFGYRTKRSMMNKKTWEFASEYISGVFDKHTTWLYNVHIKKDYR